MVEFHLIPKLQLFYLFVFQYVQCCMICLVIYGEFVVDYIFDFSNKIPVILLLRVLLLAKVSIFRSNFSRLLIYLGRYLLHDNLVYCRRRFNECLCLQNLLIN